MSNSLRPHELQHVRLPCPSLSLGVCSDSCPLSWRWYRMLSPLLPSSPFVFSLSQHQCLFQWVRSLHQVPRVLEHQLQHQSFQWTFRVEFFQDWLVWSPCCPRNSQESSPAPQFKSINFELSFHYGPTLTSMYDYWKNHSFHYMELCWQSDIFAF